MKVRIHKMNDNHDSLGRFASAGGGNRIIPQIANDPALNNLATSGGTTAKVLQQMDADTQKKFALACAGATVQPAPMDIDISFGAGGMRKIAVRHLTVDGNVIATEVTTTRYGRSQTSRCKTSKADVAGHLGSAFSDLEYSGQQITMTRSRSGKVVKSEDTTIEKFNPFHDAGGKFSSANGFSSFSANPYTKAGQMAIQRAAQNKQQYYQRVGRGILVQAVQGKNIKNVHANSKTSSATGQAHTTGENVQYLRGKRILIVGNQLQSVGGTAAANKLMRAAMNEPLPPKGAPKPATQTQAKPKQQAQNQQNQNGQQNQQAPSQQQTQQQRQVGKPYANAQGQLEVQTASGHTYYQGQDRLQEVIQNSPLKNGYTYQQLQNYYNEVCDLQGFHNKPELVQDQNAFKQMTADSGYIGYRSKNAATYLDSFAKDQTYTEGGYGGRSHDEGTYIVTNNGPQAGVEPSSYVKQICSSESAYYGTHQVKMTFQKGMKTITEDTARRQFNRLSHSERQALGNDLGLFCAAKGYDAMVYHVNGTKDYFMLHNRSKAVVKQRSSGRITYPSRNSNGYL